jgi:glycosyltransferase involved in cell wall biosynthesis
MKQLNRVLIIYKFLPHYRVDFYNGLRQKLSEQGVVLDLIYGKMKNQDSMKKDEVDISWAQFIPYKTVKFLGGELIYQPYRKYLKDYDLVIVESANKLLLNYYLIYARHFNKFKLAFWGHGRNMQDHENSWANRFKYLFLDKCDWWFAYTEGVKEFVAEKGFPKEKITAVQNAIDTRFLQQTYREISREETESIKQQLGIQGEQVGLYCSGMYPEKRLDFLIESCLNVKKAVPDFHMIFIGAGVHDFKVKEAAGEHPWIHYVGPKFGTEKVPYFKMAALQLMPGLVGLGVLDSFALQTPIVTTPYEFHSPEIEYLEDGRNGYMADNHVDAFAQTVIQALLSESYKDMLDYCQECAGLYTNEAMVNNFAGGILDCLELQKTLVH